MQMIQLTSVLALSVEIVQQACTMASSPARAARASSSAASVTSVCTAAAVTRTVRCHASSATAASTAACSSVCKWGWTAKVKCGHVSWTFLHRHLFLSVSLVLFFGEIGFGPNLSQGPSSRVISFDICRCTVFFIDKSKV